MRARIMMPSICASTTKRYFPTKPRNEISLLHTFIEHFVDTHFIKKRALTHGVSGAMV